MVALKSVKSVKCLSASLLTLGGAQKQFWHPSRLLAALRLNSCFFTLIFKLIVLTILFDL